MTPLTEQEYPRFSDAEYARRREALSRVMQRREVDHLLIVTDQRTGNAPQWVTGWPGTVEAFVIFSPDEPITMHVEWYNHVPLAKRMAVKTEVIWGGHAGIDKVVDDLKRRGAKRVGFMGPLAYRKCRKLEGALEDSPEGWCSGLAWRKLW